MVNALDKARKGGQVAGQLGREKDAYLVEALFAQACRRLALLMDDPPAQVLPQLDEALQALNDSDRLAVLLRFFLKKPIRTRE